MQYGILLAMKTKLALSQVQKTILAPSMQQSISILALPLADLDLAIEQELQNNPLLEINEDEPQMVSVAAHADITKNNIQRQREILRLQRMESFSEDERWEEKPLFKELPLEDSLLEQLRFEFSEPLQLKIGETIIGNLDEDGYLRISCDEIAQSLCPNHLALVEHVLQRIQNFEPVGIASRDLKECLKIQLSAKYDDPADLGATMIDSFLAEVGSRKYSEIARKLATSLELVKDAANKIASLEPKPARNYRPINANIYIKPDVIIHQDPIEGFQVTVNQEGLPNLRINLLYQRLLLDKNLKEAEKEFVKEKLRNATNFIRSLEQRGQTIKEIAEYILDKQKDFFGGAHLSIHPMTLKDVAVAINHNESTVSRAIQNKYVDTPQGLVPLRFFFSQGLPHQTQGPVSSRSIKEEIKDLIDAEQKTAPLSDQELQEHFQKKGFNIARRTISKYRQQLNILPSHLRKE